MHKVSGSVAMTIAIPMPAPRVGIAALVFGNSSGGPTELAEGFIDRDGNRCSQV